MKMEDLDGLLSLTTDAASINKTGQDDTVTPASGLVGVTLSQDVYDGLINTAAYFSIIMGIPGIIANILIIVTYAKMGITNSINASYTAMAVSDLGCVITTIWFEILLIPQFQAWKALPFAPMEIIFTTAAYPNMAFSKTTSWITAYISLERCLCVAFPHKVKLLFTKRLTVIVLIIIALISAVPAALAAFWVRLEWKVFTNALNETVRTRVRYKSPTANFIWSLQNWLYGTVYHWVPIGITVIGSIFLAIYLRAGTNWRRKALQISKNEEKFDPKSSKEELIIKTVLSISILSIILSTPLSINFIFTLVAPELSPFIFVRGIGTVLAAFATSMTMINSCLNMLIYYRLGTKFRATLKQLLRLDTSNSTLNEGD